MKYLSLLLLFLMPVMAPAQVTTCLQDGGYYYVVVEGDTVSQHTRVDKAIESASEYPDWEIVQDFRLSGSSLFYDEDIIIEEVTDTVYADTVYVNLPPHDNSFLHSVDWTHEVDFESGEERIDFVIKSETVDSLITEIRCGNDWVKERVFPDAENDIAKPANTLQYGILWDCDSDLIYQFRAHKGVWEQAITERFPAFAFELTEDEQALIDGVKKKSDIEMAYLKITNDSLLWTNAGHDNAVFLLDHPSVPAEFWNDVSAGGGNIRVYFWDGSTETAVAREVVDVDTVGKTGQIYFDSSNSLANTANEWRIYAETGLTEPAFTDPLGRNTVWGGFEAVYHGGDAVDHSGNGNNLTEIGTVPNEVGEIGDSYGVLRGVNYFTSPIIGDIDKKYLSAWIYYDNFSGGAVDTFGSFNSNERFYMGSLNSGSTPIAGWGSGAVTSGPALSLFTWYKQTLQVDVNSVEGYLNGELFGSSIESFGSSPDSVYIGDRNGGGVVGINGRLDEVRISNNYFGADYESTEYNNQSDPDAFWTVELVEEDTATALSGSINTKLSLAADLVKTSFLTGNIGSESAFAGKLYESARLSGLTESDSLLSGDLSKRAALRGQIAGLSDFQGSLVMNAVLAGQVSVESVLSGNVIILDDGILSLSGSVDAQTALSGNLSVLTQVRGIIESQTDLSGSVIQQASLSGDVLTVSATSAQVVVAQTLSGAAFVSSEISGELSRLGEAWVGRIDITNSPMHTIRFKIKPMHNINIQVKS